MELTDILTIIAIVVGPIAAVQIEKWKERYQEKKNRQINIFKTLMWSRGARLSLDHVNALNMIDTEFYQEKKIINAWKNYLDCLCQKANNEHELKQWGQKRDELFVKLLSEMAKLLGYEFDDVHLKNAVYIPQAYGKEEEYQYFIREKIQEILKGEKAIPMIIVDNNAKQLS